MSIVSPVVCALSFVVPATLSVLIWPIAAVVALECVVLSMVILSAVTVCDALCVLLVVHCVCC